MSAARRWRRCVYCGATCRGEWTCQYCRDLRALDAPEARAVESRAMPPNTTGEVASPARERVV